jgi:NAD(P)-dependent dehydrogenase (short-subunit alcohol dehydrogenase family)
MAAAQPREIEVARTPAGELTGRVALVTGGTKGIGLATARRLVEEGALVAILGRSDLEQARDQVARAEYGDQVLAIRCDVTSEADVIAAVEETCQHFGQLNIAVNNAGVSASIPFEEMTLDEWNWIMDVNCTGSFLVSREAVRAFLRQGKGGVLVYVNSDNSLKPSKHFAAYNASKAAVLHLARTIANELGPHQIRANSILPGAVFGGSAMWTPELRAARAQIHGFHPDNLEEEYKKNNALGVIIDPEEIAELVVFLACDRSAKMTGNALVIDGGGLGGYVR